MIDFYTGLMNARFRNLEKEKKLYFANPQPSLDCIIVTSATGEKVVEN